MDKRWSFDLNRFYGVGVYALMEKFFWFFFCCLGPVVRGYVLLYCNSVGRYFSASLQYNYILIDQKKKINQCSIHCSL